MSCNHNNSRDSNSDHETRGERQNITQRIIEEIAAREQVDPIALDPPLYTAIDAEVLESLFAKTDGDLEITFRWKDYIVVVNQEEVFVDDEE